MEDIKRRQERIYLETASPGEKTSHRGLHPEKKTSMSRLLSY